MYCSATLVCRDIFYQFQTRYPFNGGESLRELLEIPPPVTEENKAEYLQELERISEAENWIEKHSVRSIESESIDKNIPKNSTLPVLEPKSPDDKRFLSLILLSMLTLFLFIVGAEFNGEPGELYCLGIFCLFVVLDVFDRLSNAFQWYLAALSLFIFMILI